MGSLFARLVDILSSIVYLDRPNNHIPHIGMSFKKTTKPSSADSWPKAQTPTSAWNHLELC